LDELAEGISRGKATILLSTLAQRYPETFQGPESAEEDKPITLPLQKLIQQIDLADRRAAEKGKGSSSTPPPAENTLGSPLREPPPALAKEPEHNVTGPIPTAPHPGLTKYEPFGQVRSFPEMRQRPAEEKKEPTPVPPLAETVEPTSYHTKISEPTPSAPASSVEQKTAPLGPAEEPKKVDALPRTDRPVFGEVVSSLQAPGRHKAKEVKVDVRPIPPRSKFVSDLAALAMRTAPRASAAARSSVPASNSPVAPEAGNPPLATPAEEPAKPALLSL
jgi:hypothetical protein